MAAEGRLAEALIPGAALLPEFPAVIVDSTTAAMVRQGRDFPVSPFRVQAGTRYVKAVSTEGELVAIGEATVAAPVSSGGGVVEAGQAIDLRHFVRLSRIRGSPRKPRGSALQVEEH